MRKIIITFFLALFCIIVQAQDEVYLHTSNAGNIAAATTILDHPDLNGDANANFFFTHNFGTTGGNFHNIPTGTFYNGTNWTIFNEDHSNMAEDISFNVFIANDASVIEGTADGTNNYYYLDNALINNDPDAVVIAAKYWNPNGVYNTQNYGFWYDGSNWILFAEDLNNHPANASYKFLLTPGSGSESFIHTSTLANISSNWTVIDHPLLNDNPTAGFVVQHNWGASGDPSNIIHDKVIGVWYTGTNWAIYNEDVSTMAENLEFNVYLADPSLAVGDTEQEITLSLFPNPAQNFINVVTNQTVTSIEIHNILGQKALQLEDMETTENIDISRLHSGTYLVTIITDVGKKTLKLIKK